jgi:hypothetical protein
MKLSDLAIINQSIHAEENSSGPVLVSTTIWKGKHNHWDKQ